MEVIFKNGKYFKKLIENCCALITSGTLKFKSDGVSLNAIDNNNVALIIFDIETSNFTKYNLKNDCDITLNFDYLASKVFKSYRDTDELKIVYKENTDKIKFIFANPKIKRVVTHIIPLLNSEGQELEVEESKHDSIITITPMTLSTITKDCSKFGDNLQISTISGEPNRVKFIIGDIDGKAEHLYEENDEDIQDITIVNETNVSFLMSYLVKFSNFCGMAHSVKLYINNQNPMIYEFVTSIGIVKLYLSPKLED